MVSNLTVEPENVQELDFENFDNFVLEPNQLAKDRMNGIVEDYAKQGIIWYIWLIYMCINLTLRSQNYAFFIIS